MPYGFDTKYQVPFYLGQIKPALKLCKIPKYYEEDCRYNFSFLRQSYCGRYIQANIYLM